MLLFFFLSKVCYTILIWTFFSNMTANTVKYSNSWGFPGGSGVKNLPTMQETQVRYLGWEHPLEKEMATHCSILAWEIPWTEKPGSLQSMGLQKSRTQLSN